MKITNDPNAYAKHLHRSQRTQVVGKAIPYPHGALVVGRKAVVLGQQGQKVRLEGFIVLECRQALCREKQVVDVCTPVVERTERGEGT